MYKSLISALLLVGFFGSFLSATEAVPTKPKPLVSPQSIEKLREVVRRYQRSGIVEMKVEKKVISELLGKDRVYTGKLAVAPHRFRFETEDPDKTLVIYDGKFLWNVQYPPKDGPGQIQVARAQLDKKNQNQVMLSDILVGQTIVTEFQFLSEKTEGDQLSFVAKPKKSEDAMTNLTIIVDTKVREITEINYSDELGNKTIMKFSELKLKKKPQPSVFDFKPEKGTEVIDL